MRYSNIESQVDNLNMHQYEYSLIETLIGSYCVSENSYVRRNYPIKILRNNRITWPRICLEERNLNDLPFYYSFIDTISFNISYNSLKDLDITKMKNKLPYSFHAFDVSKKAQKIIANKYKICEHHF